MSESFVNEMIEIKEEEVYKMTKERIDAGEDPQNILTDMRKAMAIVGERFDKKEYFIPELIMTILFN